LPWGLIPTGAPRSGDSFVGLFFAATSIGINLLYQNQSLKLFLINAGRLPGYFSRPNRLDFGFVEIS
jgi:hypothetical protein